MTEVTADEVATLTTPATLLITALCILFHLKVIVEAVAFLQKIHRNQKLLSDCYQNICCY